MTYAAEKTALRRRSLATRDALDPAVRARHSGLICRTALATACSLGARCVALYAPIGSEVDVQPLLLPLLDAGLTVSLPRMRADRRLDFVAVTSFAQLTVHAFGVREPAGAPLLITQLDLVMAPGLAFDAEGHRLGYGGGYYDRTLLGYTGQVMGIAFACQCLASLPAAPHDRRVDGIATELGFETRPTPLNSGQTSAPVAP